MSETHEAGGTAGTGTRPTMGFIGLGMMGHGMAGCLVRDGFELAVLANRSRDGGDGHSGGSATNADDLASRGARKVSTPAELAEHASVIHLCLPGSPEIEEVVFGPNGLLEAVGDAHLVIDTSTASPPSTMRVAEALSARGCRFADAPLSRTPKEAAEGTLDAMVGADDETFALAEPAIRSWAEVVVRTGGVGTGHTMKLLNNFVAMGYGALYSEALAVGAKAGVSADTFHAVIGAGRLSNGFYDTFMRYVIERDPDAHRFALANAAKDMRYLASLANEVGAVNPIGAAVRNTYAAAVAAGRGDAMLPMISDFVAEANGVSHEPDERGKPQD